MVSPTTTREVLYVSATRGTSPTASTSTPPTTPIPLPATTTRLDPMTARVVLAAVLRSQAADLAAHETILREQHEAESLEQLSAEYLTLATTPKPNAGMPSLARSGLSDAELDSVRPARPAARSSPHCATPKPAVSTSRGPAEARGRPIADRR